MNFVYIDFEQGAEMLTLSSMEKQLVEYNLVIRPDTFYYYRIFSETTTRVILKLI